MSYEFAAVIHVTHGKELMQKHMQIFCQQPEIVYLLEGDVGLSGAQGTNGQSYMIREGGFALLSPARSYSFSGADSGRVDGGYPGQSSAGDFTIARIKLDFQFLHRGIGERIWTMPVVFTQKEGQAARLLEAVQHLLIEYAEQGDTGSTRYLMLSCSLYLELEEILRQNSAHPTAQTANWDPWTLKTLDYIYLHYAEHISLTDIAKEQFTSAATISRHFAQSTGQFFAEYLKEFRLEKARNALENEDKSITTIALENGFPSLSTFSRAFQENYQESPREYQKRTRENNRRGQLLAASGDRKALRKALKRQNVTLSPVRDNQKRIVVDLACGPAAGDAGGRVPAGGGVAGPASAGGDAVVTASVGGGVAGPASAGTVPAGSKSSGMPSDVSAGMQYEDRLQILNIGPAERMMSGVLQNQILELHRTFHFAYYRIWSVFSPALIMVQPGTGRINYSPLDSILDFFVANDMKLFLDLGRMTNLTRVDERQFIAGTQEQRFASASDWKSYLDRFLVHIVSRYGQKIAASWIYEFSFFLNTHPYYEGDNYRAGDAWESAWQALRRIIPGAKIAGPGLISSPDEEYMEMLIRDFLQKQREPDIFTVMHFPYSTDDSKPQSQQVDASLKKQVQPDFMRLRNEMIRKCLRQNQYDGALAVTDWNCSISNRNYIEDSCYRGTFYVKNYLENWQSAQLFGIFYASDLISNYADSASPFCGSAGILSRDGLKKPVYYAVAFLKRLQGSIVSSGSNHIVTTDGTGNCQILCHNHQNLGPRYFLMEEGRSTPENLERSFAGFTTKDLSWRLDHLENGHYILRQYILNETHGDALANWIYLEKPDLSVQEAEYLRQTSIPQMERHRLEVSDGTLQLHVHLEPDELRLIEIMKEAR